jgi:hypothetical protein
MTFIPEEKFQEYFNILTVKDRKFYSIPWMICVKCFALVSAEIKHSPKGIEIADCNCKQK